MTPVEHLGPHKMPDPWLFDSESPLRELDRCRELGLKIPITSPNATHFQAEPVQKSAPVARVIARITNAF